MRKPRAISAGFGGSGFEVKGSCLNKHKKHHYERDEATEEMPLLVINRGKFERKCSSNSENRLKTMISDENSSFFFALISVKVCLQAFCRCVKDVSGLKANGSHLL